MDVWSIKETFLDRFYEKYGFTIQPNWKIIDIGAGIGDYTLYTATAQPNSQVFAFEPYPKSLVLMQENLRLNSIRMHRLSTRRLALHPVNLYLTSLVANPYNFRVFLSRL